VNLPCRIAVVILALGALLLSAPHETRAQGAGGNRDFDFAFGTWETRISFLRRRPNAAASWATMNGTVVTRKVWSGRANLEEIEANGPSGRFEGMTLRLYDPRAREWNLYWANSNDGAMGTPVIGTFHHGSGAFYDQEVADGKVAFLRQRYYDVTPTSYRFEQSVSHDGGAHWLPNFRAALSRRQQPTVTPQPVMPLPKAQHDFDWQFGSWNVRMARLDHPLSGSSSWTDLHAHVLVSKIWNGRANLAEISASGPSERLEFLALRLFQPQSGQWSLNFAGVKNGQLGVPLFGTFKNGRGDFYDQEPYNGKTIWIRFSFYDIGSASARDEQAFSDDAGTTWQVNWINVHTRALPSP
jgi:hypothetical protein